MTATDSSGDYHVPFGWIAFVTGIVVCAAGVLSAMGWVAKTDYPVAGLGLALVVGGYIACFIIPPLHRRVTDLERRLKSAENKQPDKAMPNSNQDAT